MCKNFEDFIDDREAFLVGVGDIGLLRCSVPF